MPIQSHVGGAASPSGKIFVSFERIRLFLRFWTCEQHDQGVFSSLHASSPMTIVLSLDGRFEQ
jgi:hypothetical protein